MSISTAVTSMKDEAPYILEWVAYHRAVGFDRIVVLANDCTDGTHEILQRLHEIGAITYIENVVPLGAKPHSRALKLANVCEDVTTADYVMVLDADEFLVIKQAPHTIDFLINKMASHSADMMVIPWRLFGSSHNETYEDRPIIDRFTQSMDVAKLPKVGVKTLFRQSRNKRLAIHFPKPLMKGGKKVEDTSDEIWIDAGGKVLNQATLTWNGGRNKIHRDFAEVAHFMIKSLDEYLLKIFRGDGLMNSNRHGVDYWRGADKNDVADLIVADNIAGFHEEYARLQSDPVLADFHKKAVKSRFERLESILANHDVQALRAILRRATSGSLTQDDIVEARRLVNHMSPSIKKEKLIEGDVPHSTLLSITNAGLADAATLGKRMFEKSRTNATMFWPEKDFAKRPLANLVEGLTRAQKNGRTANLSARWFHNYTRAEPKDGWLLDEEILVVLTRDDDVILEQYPAYIARTRDKFVEKSIAGFAPLREVIKGHETPADMQALIDAKRVNDPRARLALFVKDHPEAVVLNLDHPQDVVGKLAQIEARGPSGPLAAKLLREVLDISPETHSSKDADADSPQGVATPPQAVAAPRQPDPREPPRQAGGAGAPPAVPRADLAGKKVGIITLPLSRNIGGNLQSYALMEVLKGLGCAPVLINRKYNKPVAARDEAPPLISNTIGMGGKVPNRMFIEANIQPISRGFYSDEDLRDHIADFEFDAVITGSDQIWRPKYARDLLPDLFLNFVTDPNTRRISYAASFGTDKWEYDPAQTAAAIARLKQFTAISVREDSAKALCEQHLGMTVEHVLDPTLLLGADHYVPLIADHKVPDDARQISTYILDRTPDKQALAAELSDQLGLPVRTTNGTLFLDAEEKSHPNSFFVEGWLAAFHGAEFVLTDSFHGMAFSILFNKPFIAYGNQQRGLGRFTSLLRLVGLEDRLVVDAASVDIAQMLKPIDWEAVNERLAGLRTQSMAFLANALGAPVGEDGRTQSHAPLAQPAPSSATGSPQAGLQAMQPMACANAEPVENPLNTFCTGCGACAAEAGQAVTMRWSGSGFLMPHLAQGQSATPAQDILRVCPFNPDPEEVVKDEDALGTLFLGDAALSDPTIGRYENCYIGYSKAFRPTSSSGGIGTYVFEQLLARGDVDALVVVQGDDDSGFRYRMFHKGEDLGRMSKTRYFPVTLNEVFEKIDAFDGRVAVSGVACFIKAIRLRQHYNPELKSKIAFLVGIICGGLKSRFFTDFLAQSTGAKGSYKHPEYRVKSPESMASDYSFSVMDAKDKQRSVRMRKLGDMWGTGLFKSKACDFCTDAMTELADLSLGDAWLPDYNKDGMGHNVVITRSALADEIIQHGIAIGALEGRFAHKDLMIRSQKGGVTHKMETIKFRKWMTENFDRLPAPYVRERLLTDINVVNMMVQLLRDRVRAKSLRNWRENQDAKTFKRAMEPARRMLKAVTSARKEADAVNSDVQHVLNSAGPGLRVDCQVAAIRPLLRWLNRELSAGRLNVDMLLSIAPTLK
ncbi:hypothetical protein ERN12_15555 [Rhodobacteraceae bacterium]|nr:hypothetical protein ERN12_15555 [Paracoccaceae bacterium]